MVPTDAGWGGASAKGRCATSGAGRSVLAYSNQGRARPGRSFPTRQGRGGARPASRVPRLRMARCVSPSQQPAWRRRGHKTEEAEPRPSRDCALTPGPGTGWRGRLVRFPVQSFSPRCRFHRLRGGPSPKWPSRLSLAFRRSLLTRVLGSRNEGPLPESRIGLGLIGRLRSGVAG